MLLYGRISMVPQVDGEMHRCLCKCSCRRSYRHINKLTNQKNLHIYIYIHIYAYIYMHIYIYCICIHICIHTYMHMCEYPDLLKGHPQVFIGPRLNARCLAPAQRLLVLGQPRRLWRRWEPVASARPGSDRY